MELKNQVCALDQAKRLKQLGVEQNSYFHWQHFPGFKQGIVYREESTELVSPAWKESICDPGEAWSAFTVAELGVMLPNEYSSDRYDLCEVDQPWKCRESFENKVTDTYGSTEAQARAAMLIYLLENKLITPEQVNASLTQQQ